jgi:hypothetical protein
MSESRPNFRLIKERVSMLDVLSRYKVELRARNETKREGKCPLPQHGNRDGKASFHVDLKNGVWVWACHETACGEARGGKKKGGDLIEFVGFMEKCNLRQSGEFLESWYGPFGDAPVSATPPGPLGRSAGAPKVNPPLGFSLQGVDFRHEYLVRRGFDEEECEYLGVGLFSGKGSMSGRIVFPIHNAAGELVAYAGRLTDDALISEATPRWKFPVGFKRGSDLYNLNRVTEDDWTEVIVLESFWGVLACVRAGIFNSVALMSNFVTDSQVRQLAGFRRVTVLLDGDAPGREGARDLVEKLTAAGVEEIELKMLRDGRQPDDLPPDTLRACLGIPKEPEVPLELVDHPHRQAVGA